MHEVARLDFSLPPPGRERYGMTFLVLGIEGQGLQTIAEAWAHHKARHEPPGMTEVFGCGGLRDGEVARGWKFRSGIASDEGMHATSEAARAAAWAWYERRLALARRVDDFDGDESQGPISPNLWVAYDRTLPFWPRILTWTDEQVGEVERWLTDSSAEMPAVIGGKTAA